MIYALQRPIVAFTQLLLLNVITDGLKAKKRLAVLVSTSFPPIFVGTSRRAYSFNQN
jgi:hypothetical protein